MSELTPTITKAVETGAAKLLNHFKEQYGAAYFKPLGVNDKTPGEIAPMVSQTIEEQTLVYQENQTTINVIDERIGVVFNVFVDKFYESLSLLGKGLMKSFGLKMTRNDYLEGLNKRKAEKPESYKTWKDNLNLILQTIFDEIIIALNAQGKTVYISNGEKFFSSSREAAEAMKIYQ
jgi:hypothetical protein